MDIFYFIFIALLLVYLLFLSGVLKGISNLRGKQKYILPEEFVTVIIPFRNESEHILDSLKSLQSQNYPKNKFEVIYINDCSEDDSLEKICSADKPENIRVLSFNNRNSNFSHKKQAVQFGIEQAKGEIIVTTDCDCYHGTQWLRTLLSYYDKNTAFISGPVIFENDNSSFQQMQSLEFAGLILVGAGLIGIRKPVICNAANLTFRKNVFDKVNGYHDNIHLSSGDDEFLMRKISSQTGYEIKFAFNAEARTFTFANENIEQFYQQRKRWASKSLFYNKTLIISLAVIFLFFLSVPVQLVLGFFLSAGFLLTFMISFFCKMLMEFLVLIKGSGITLSEVNKTNFLLAELLHIPYIIIVVISGLFGNFKWKNRNLKR